MNPVKVRAVAYRSYDELEIVLPAGSVAVVGDNGAGKSSLIEIIPLALFGTPPGFRNLAPFLSRGSEETEMMLELTFEHGDETYRVRRSYSGRGRGQTKVDFERAFYEPDAVADTLVGWESLTRETARETDRAIEEMLGLSRPTFCASAYLAQGEGGNFAEADPRERKAILAEVLGLAVYDRLLERARVDIRADEQRLAVLAAETERAESELANRPTLLEEKGEQELAVGQERVAIERLEADLEQARLRFQEMREQRAAVETARAEAKAASETLTRLQMVVAAGTRAKAELPAVEAQLAGLPNVELLAGLERRETTVRERCEAYDRQTAAWEAGKREYALADSQRRALVAQAEELVQEATDLDLKAGALEHEPHPDTKCELCGQTLGEEARKTAVAAWRVRAGDLREGARDREAQAAALVLPEIPAAPEGERPDSGLHAATVALREAREQAVQAGALRERIGTLQQTIDQAEDADFLVELRYAADNARVRAAELEQAEEAAPAEAELETLRGKGDALRYELDETRKRLSLHERAVAHVEAELARLDNLAAQIAEARTEREHLHAELDVLEKLERAYSRDGIPALIVENAAIPQIENEASRILTEFGLPWRVELRTQKALKSG
ncbi:MAG: AAA family ATPase, partial [Thermoleophilaceae bacterium]